mgnify:CR=1 FL=1
MSVCCVMPRDDDHDEAQLEAPSNHNAACNDAVLCCAVLCCVAGSRL